MWNVETLTSGTGDVAGITLRRGIAGARISRWARAMTSLTMSDGGEAPSPLTIACHTLTGERGADVIALSAVVSGMSVDLEAGNNALTLANGTSVPRRRRRPDADRRRR